MCCKRKPGAQFLKRFQRLEALDRIGGHGLARWRDQISISAMMRSADTASELVNLRQAKSVRAVDDDGVGGRHVDAALDNGRTDQNVEAAMIEIQHELFELAL